MRSRVLHMSLVLSLVACAAQQGGVPDCSSVKSAPNSDSKVFKDLKAGTMKSGWGGVIDLLETPETTATSKRSRCTVFMDYVPVASGQKEDPLSIAFWTADHCLNFSDSKGAELNIFDPEKKRYHRFSISIPDLETYRAGLKLFEDRVFSSANVGDVTAAADLDSFKYSAKRLSVTLNGAPLIERGATTCKTDTQAHKTTKTDETAICSTVLDLARVNANVQLPSAGSAELTAILTRMAKDLKAQEDARLKMAEDKIPNIGTYRSNFIFFLKQWRKRIAVMTQFRSFESQSELIEKVRQCATDDFTGICAQVFRDHYKTPLDQYKVWVKDDPSGSVRNFPTALHDEVYAEPNANNADRHNIKWILGGQEAIGKYSFMGAEVFFASNLLRPGYTMPAVKPPPTLGESGPLFYGLVPAANLAPNVDMANPLAQMLFKPSTVLVPYPKAGNNITIAMQPGDSGSLLVIGGIPIAVLSTVDGVETSGGASIRALPEYVDEPDSTSSMNQAGGTSQPKTTAQVGCK